MSLTNCLRAAASLAAGLALFASLAFSQNNQVGNPGQGQGQGQPPGGAVGRPPGGQPGGQQPIPGRTNQPPFGEDQRFPEQQQRPIFFSGKVVLEDGTPPPDFVNIERVCNGIARTEAHTDSKGRFSFQLGQNMGVMQDASVSSTDPSFGGSGRYDTMQRGVGGNLGNSRGMSERDLMGCELRAVLPGFRSEAVNLAGRRAFDNPDVGTIILRRLGNVEGTTISATSLMAPKDSKKAFEKGRDLVKKKKLPEAEKEFEKAVQSYPKYAVAWFELGRLQEQHNDVEAARKSYSEALSADSKFVSPYLQMALLSAKENNWQEVVDITDRAVRLNPIDFPQAYFYNSIANYNLKKLDAAEKSAREAQKLDSQHRMPRIDQLLGTILADKRDYSGAAEQMKSYLKFVPNAQDAENVKKQLVELEKLAASGAPPKSEP